MGTPNWQRELLRTLTELRAGQQTMTAEIAALRTETNASLSNLRADVAGLATRLDNALTTTLGEPLRQLQSRVRRLETQVFPNGPPDPPNG